MIYTADINQRLIWEKLFDKYRLQEGSVSFKCPQKMQAKQNQFTMIDDW